MQEKAALLSSILFKQLEHTSICDGISSPAFKLGLQHQTYILAISTVTDMAQYVVTAAYLIVCSKHTFWSIKVDLALQNSQAKTASSTYAEVGVQTQADTNTLKVSGCF